MSQDTFMLSIGEARAIRGLLAELVRRGYADVEPWAGPLAGLYARLSEPGVLTETSETSLGG